jgi:hypothetical protein
MLILAQQIAPDANRVAHFHPRTATEYLAVLNTLLNHGFKCEGFDYGGHTEGFKVGDFFNYLTVFKPHPDE